MQGMHLHRQAKHWHDSRMDAAPQQLNLVPEGLGMHATLRLKHLQAGAVVRSPDHSDAADAKPVCQAGKTQEHWRLWGPIQGRRTQWQRRVQLRRAGGTPPCRTLTATNEPRILPR